MRWRAAAALILVSALLQSCGGSAVTPTPPSSTSPTLVSVVITGSPSMYVGTTAQLRASANYAKGSPVDVTTQVTWASAAPSVATISPSGMLAAVGTGTADITANYQGVTGTLRLTVNRVPVFTLSGTVTETFPTSSTPVGGALVQILDGPNQGRSATTDSNGQYQITALLAGTGSVRAHAANYDDATTNSVTIGNDTPLSFMLNPTAKQIHEDIVSDISGGGPSTCYLQGGTTPFPCRLFPVPLHNPGPLQASVAWQSTNDAIFVLQLYNGDADQVISQAPVVPSDTSTATILNLSAAISTPGNYQLRVVAFRISKTVIFTLTTTHMN